MSGVRPGSAAMPGRAGLAALAALAALTLALHGEALTGFWRLDDGMHLDFATRYGPLDYFFDPLVTRGFSSNNLAPWNPFVYDLNLALFGMRPMGFYAHHLAVLAVAAGVTFLLLRPFTGAAAALAAAALFLVGAPTLHVARELMTGHYLAGLLFAALALLWFLRALRDGSRLHLCVAWLAFVLATACKEVYVPLPLLLPFLPLGPRRRRLAYSLPFFLWLGVYALWRREVLGSFVGGYQPGGAPLDPGAIVVQLAQVPQLLLGGGTPALIAVLSGAVALAWVLYRREISPVGLLAGAVAALGPLIPLAVAPGLEGPNRYLFFPWWAASVLTGILVGRLRWPLGAILVAVVGGSAASQALLQREVLQPLFRFYETSYRLALENRPGRVLYQERNPDALYMDLVLNGAVGAQARLEGTEAERLNVAVARGSIARLAAAGYEVLAYREEGGDLVPAPAGADLPGAGPSEPTRDFRYVPYRPPYPRVVHGFGGSVDRVRREGQRLRVTGWLPLRDFDPEQRLVLLSVRRPRSVEIVSEPRPDVVRAMGDPALRHSGFRLDLSFSSEAEAKAAAQALCVVARSVLTGPSLVRGQAVASCDAFLSSTARPVLGVTRR